MVLGSRKMSEFGDFSGSHFPVFSLNTNLDTGKYGPDKNPNSDPFQGSVDWKLTYVYLSLS